MHLIKYLLVTTLSKAVCSFMPKKNAYRQDAIITTDTLPCFLVISDIHLESNLLQRQIPDDTANTGSNLWQATQMEINAVTAAKHPQFVLVLGDVQPHNTAVQDDANHNFIQVLRWFKDSNTILQQTPVIFVPGNNDPWTGDYNSFSLPDSFFSTYHFPLIDFSHKAAFISREHQQQCGYYSLYPTGKKGGLRLIVLNSTQFSVNYQGDTSDATVQLNWLKEQLKDAGNEQVIIAMHVPPGSNGFDGGNLWKAPAQDSFLDIIARFSKNIAGMLSSHTHQDGIRLLIDSNNSHAAPSALLVSIPGIAPGHGNNPSIKLINYNPGQHNAITNFTTYYMHYWDTDSTGSVKTWSDSFNCRTAFSLPYTGNSLLNDIKTLPPDLMRKYADSMYTVHGKNDTAVTATKTTAPIESSVYVTRIK